MSGSHKTVVNLTLPKNVVKPFLNKPVSNQINGNTSDERQFYYQKRHWHKSVTALMPAVLCVPY